MWPFLPILIDGSKGFAAWMPVHHTHNGKEEDLVVLSMRLVEFSMKKLRVLGLVDASDNEIWNMTIRLGFLERFRREKIGIDEFTSILLKTPFKRFNREERNGSITKQNRSQYVIVGAEYFRRIQVDICLMFPDRPLALPPSFFDIIPRNIGVQRYATTAHHADLGRNLTLQEREECPAMGIPWWREVYRKTCCDFFNMGEGMFQGHIVNGVYTTSAGIPVDFNTMLQNL